MTDLRKGLQQAIHEGVRQIERNYKAVNPEARRLKVKATVAAYTPRPKEVRRAPVRAVALFLSDPSYLAKSNAEIAAELGREVGRKLASNILTERLTPRQAKEIGELLEMRKVTLDLATHDTASKIKKALKGRQKSASAVVTRTVTVSFSADAVVVGDRSYPIQQGNGVPRIHVGRSKLNVDALQALLCKSK